MDKNNTQLIVAGVGGILSLAVGYAMMGKGESKVE
jgi:hypothetical protein